MSANLNKPGCPFCDDAQAYRYILELPLVRAIYPKSPASDYHILILPKRHTQYFDALSPQELEQCMTILQMIVKAARQNLVDFTGYNLLSNNGSEAVNQRVKHCHMHVFLRTASEAGDPLATHSHTPASLTPAQLQNMQQLQAWFKG